MACPAASGNLSSSVFVGKQPHPPRTTPQLEARTDELELRVIPVIASASYPSVIWRSHGGDSLTIAESQAATTAALNAYDPATRDESTSDKNEVIAAINAEGGDIAIRTSPTEAIYRHANDTDTLYAVVLTTSAYSATGAIVGVHVAEPGKYVFTGLADDTVYEIRIRAGAAPVVTDRAIGWIPLPTQTKAQADADQVAVLDAIAGEAGSAVGPGSIRKEITITSLGVPVDGAAVWVTMDVSGLNVIAGTLTTDTFGNVEFMLDAGTYYVWAQRAGVNFPNPSIVSVP